MKTLDLNKLATLKNQIGSWAFARYCHNQGVSFTTAYYLIFGCSPKKI